MAREVLPTALLSIRSTLRLILLAMFAAGAVAVIAVANADLARTWWRRAFLLEPLRYPRETSLAIEGFSGSIRKVGRGRDVEIVVRASGRVPNRAVLDIVNGRSGQRRPDPPLAEPPCHDRCLRRGETPSAVRGAPEHPCVS